MKFLSKSEGQRTAN